MEIENQQFFHIKRNESFTDEWKVGNKFNWDSRPNNFIKNIYSMDLQFTDGHSKISYRKAYQNLMRLPDVVKNKKLFSYFDFTNFALNRTSMMLREMVLESYRKEHFPKLPSRYNAIWVCEKHSIEYWKKALQMYNTSIVKLNLSGSLHLASDKSLYSDVLNVKQYEEQAKNYWAPNQKVTQDTEGIFDGQIEILEIT